MAIVVAMAAALLELAARRSGAPEVSSRAFALRTRVVPLAEADARAYQAVLASRGKERRAALARASEVLCQIAAAAAAVEQAATPLIERARPALRGEAIAAVELAGAARRVSKRLVVINLGGKDSSDTASLR